MLHNKTNLLDDLRIKYYEDDEDDPNAAGSDSIDENNNKTSKLKLQKDISTRFMSIGHMFNSIVSIQSNLKQSLTETKRPGGKILNNLIICLKKLMIIALN